MKHNDHGTSHPMDSRISDRKAAYARRIKAQRKAAKRAANSDRKARKFH